jgi:hypothetical protein
MAVKVWYAVTEFDKKHGEKTAGLAIIALVIYLIIAQ